MLLHWQEIYWTNKRCHICFNIIFFKSLYSLKFFDIFDIISTSFFVCLSLITVFLFLGNRKCNDFLCYVREVLWCSFLVQCRRSVRTVFIAMFLLYIFCDSLSILFRRLDLMLCLFLSSPANSRQIAFCVVDVYWSDYSVCWVMFFWHFPSVIWWHCWCVWWGSW